MLRVIPPRLIVAASVAVAAAALLPRDADAAVYLNGSATINFDVTLKIIANCTIGAANLDFGQSQGVLATAVNVNTTVNVTCTNTTLYNVGLTAGTGAGSSGTTRYMSGTGGNTGTVQFNLYQTAGSTLWGDTQGTNTVGGTGNGSSQPITVYGNIPPQATPAPDTYKSTITATVYF
ncbi:Spore coat protein U (SCPU) domain-containing protein [Janthinobacterium sp. OK676]|uniref:Csu type fimbrial protein n=1 Tax=Janthinobacterium sp. OK676 TaxID=1855295 RepID=UPI000887B2B0|nr:spore coat U domain-containing protein [Janthinobacterium sp. OK676]SDO03945.1 Spore coat protein U (SCPU) domain-containing protein [Janthinobacterium sp. OK676]